jgi:eukaryotic-like serine/threonine-protein kinase
MTKEGDPKIADFGIAKPLNKQDDSENNTPRLGVEKYMAPEFKSGGKYDYPADIYALAVTFLDCLEDAGMLLTNLRN